MLKRLEVVNFESHVHTALEDLHPGINLIRGESNSGKTALVRALKLVAYQEFDPKSVRIGETKCEVIVETERGEVKVIRGPKSNLWEVTKKGQAMRPFDKVGKLPVPEAMQVIGLNLIKLGDVEIPVNIMDQLESHFMLKSIGGENASGSIRAQIIDEISGLAGIEGVIKAVGLDIHRNGREITVLEEQMETIRKQLHDAKLLETEASLIDAANNLMKDYTEWISLANEMFEVQAELHSIDETIESLSIRQKRIPDAKKVKQLLEQVVIAQTKTDAMRAMIADCQKELCERQRLEVRLVNIRKKCVPPRSVMEIGELLEKARKMKKISEEICICQTLICQAERRHTVTQKNMEENNAAKAEILKDVKVCPLNLKPVTPQCLEGI